MKDNSVSSSKWILAGLACLAFIVILVLFFNQSDTTDVEFADSQPVFQREFTGHQNVSADSTLYMTFPEDLAKGEVEANLQIPEGLQGEIMWEENVLTYKPIQDLEEGKTYTFMVSPSAVYSSGRPLSEALEYKFTVGGGPGVSAHYPLAEATDIDDDSKINLVFNRPVLPLSAVQGSKTFDYEGDWPVSFSPYIRGQWKWLGTSTAQFTPDEPLDLATRYHVQVPLGIEMLSGEKTEADESWYFETTRPKVLYSEPGNGFEYGAKNQEIVLYFNQEMSPIRAERFIDFLEIKEGEERSVDYKIDYLIEEIDGEEEINKEALVLNPRRDLDFESNYSIRVNEGLLAADGNLGMEELFETSFKTVGQLEVKVADYDDHRLFVEFSNPLNSETAEGQFTIEPEVEGWDEIDFVQSVNYNSRYIYLFPHLDPSTQYTMKIDDGLEDESGQKLTEPYLFTFTTPPTTPRWNLMGSRGQFGIFEKSHPPVFSFETVNIEEINVELAKLSLAEFLEIQQRKKESYSYDPLLSQYQNFQQLKLEDLYELNVKKIVNLDLEETIGSSPETGIYALKISSPQMVDWEGRIIERYQYFSLANTALTLKYSHDTALVWAIDMATGEPIKDTPIEFHSLNGEVKLRGQTDAEGFFETPLDLNEFATTRNESDPEFWVTTSGENGFSFIGNEWNDGIEPYAFGISQDFKYPAEDPYRLDAYVYTERNLYRAGDTVYYKGILRLRDANGVITTPDTEERQVLVMVRDAEGNEIVNETLSINEFGSFNGEFPVDVDAPLGSYYLSVSLTPEDEIGYNYSGHSFNVLAFRKPEFKVELTPETEDYFSEDTLHFDLNASYFFGAPMKDATVEWSARSQDYFFNRYTDGWYSFALEDAWCWWQCERRTESITEGKTELDEEGYAEIEFPYTLEEKAVSQIITVEANILDQNNQSVTGSASAVVHPADVYVGIRNQDYVVLPGQEAKFDIITVTPQGDSMADQQVTVELFEREWNTIRKKSVDGYYYYENEAEDTFVREVTITTNEQGKAVASILVEEGGQYRAVATVRDDKRRENKSGTSFYAFSSSYINWPHQNNDKIDVLADKPEYAVGDTAKLLIKSPYQGENVKALITIERENLMEKKVIQMESNAQPFEIEITEDMIPNVYVSAIIIKPRTGDTFDENGEDTGIPAFKMGYAHLNVETEQKRLQLEIETDQDKYQPRDTVSVKLNVSDFEGNPVQAEVSLGVVDASLRALLGFEMPDLIRVFYGERGLGVRTSQMLLHLIETFKPGSKGGGGGLEGEEKRDDFKDTAFWQPNILTGEDGKAEVSFELPDNLTTWHFLAIAHTKDSLYSAADHEVVETKNVILRPVRPRFAVQGDQIEVGAIVHNFTDETSEFTVVLTGEGFDQEVDEHDVTLEPGEDQKLIFPITVLNVDQLTFDFRAIGEVGNDWIEETIPVYEFNAPQSVATTGILMDEMIEEGVYIPAENEARIGSMSAIISPTVASYLPDGLEYVAEYPYGCSEQTVSSFLSNVAVHSLEGFEAFEIMDDETLKNNITAGLSKLYTFQRFDGGFGYWIGSWESNAYLSAYILFALDKTKEAGYAVDEDVMIRTKNFLNQALRWTGDREVSLTTRAYILYVLAEVGERDVNLLDNLYERRDELPLFSQAYLAMAYESESDKAFQMGNEMLNYIKIDPRGAHFEEESEFRWRRYMNTNTNTTALVLQALLRTHAENEQLPRVVRYLLHVRERGHWDTTQSTTNSIFALIDFLNVTGELDGDFTATVTLDGDLLMEELFNSDNILSIKKTTAGFEELERERVLPLTFEKQGQGRLYYDVTLDYLLELDAIEPLDRGMGIMRELTDLETGELDPQLKAGEVYKIKLTMTVPQDRHFVAVSSPLPAGFEAIDFNFQINQASLQEEINQPEEDELYWERDLWRFNHTEFRDDQVLLFADYLPAGAYEYEYLVRATTPGKFKYRPAHIEEMYYPEIFGQSEGRWVEIEE